MTNFFHIRAAHLSHLLALALLALPSSLLALDALPFDGWQRINTGYCPAAGDRFECEIKVEDFQPRSTAALFGTVREQEPERTFAFYVRQKGDDSSVVAYGGTARGGLFPRDRVVTLSVGPDGATWTWEGGSERLPLTPGFTMDGVTPLMIGDANAARLVDDSVPAGTGAAMTLYRFRVWRGGLELVHDYEPDQDGSRIGLRDRCGSGGFLPLEPQKVEKATVVVENAIAHVLGVTVHNPAERLTGKRDGNATAYLVRQGEDITVYYTLEPGYASLVEDPLSYPRISEDVRIDGTVIRAVRRLTENVPYRTWDAKAAAMVDGACPNAIPVTADAQVLADGQWYAVTGTVSVANLKVNGAANLILCDGATLTAGAVTNGALSVYGQAGGRGVLTVSGAVNSALTIVGGNVKVDGSAVPRPTNAMGNVVYCVTATGSEEGGAKRVEGLEEYGIEKVSSIGGNVYLWLPDGAHWFTVSGGATTNHYLAVVDGKDITVKPGVPVTPGRSVGPFATAEAATNVQAIAFVWPSAPVAKVLTSGALRRTYCDMFALGVTGGGDAWSVEAALTPAARTNLAETATVATRQIPVGAIARLPEVLVTTQQTEIVTMTVTTNVTVRGCAPGFYYSLRGSGSLEGLRSLEGSGGMEGFSVYGPELCGADAKVVFPEVKQPSKKAGFFKVGVGVTGR